MVLVLYRFRACINISMSFSTRSYSSPKEYYSCCVSRKSMCAGSIRGCHPQWIGIARRLHPHANWQYICVQQFNAHANDWNCDIILVRSQWLKTYNVVCSPPLTNMLKFGGCASMTSCTHTARYLHSQSRSTTVFKRNTCYWLILHVLKYPQTYVSIPIRICPASHWHTDRNIRMIFVIEFN